VNSPESFSQAAPVEMHRCVECHRVFSKSELMEFTGFYACPQCKPNVIAKIARGESVGSLFRRGRRLVVQKGAVLPARCVKCNAPAQGKPVEWNFFGHRVAGGLCPMHRGRMRRGALIGYGLLTVGVICMAGRIYDLEVNLSRSTLLGYLPLVGLVAWIIAPLAAFVATPFRPIRIARRHVVVKGCHPDFLAEFPDWPGE
jgi:hypothetical protein